MNSKILLSSAAIAILGFYGNAIAGGDENCSKEDNKEASDQCDQSKSRRKGLTRSKSGGIINVETKAEGENNGKTAPRKTLPRSKSGGDIDIKNYKKTVEEE